MWQNLFTHRLTLMPKTMMEPLLLMLRKKKGLTTVCSDFVKRTKLQPTFVNWNKKQKAAVCFFFYVKRFRSLLVLDRRVLLVR